MSGEEIYRNFTEARGGNDLAAASDIAGEVRGSHEEIAGEIRELAVLMESAWQGDAAGAAQRGAVPLAVEHELSAPLLGTDQDLFSRQVGSFEDARNRVVPVPPAPEKPPAMSILFAPGMLPTYDRELANHNAAAQNNVDAMMGYEGASRHNAENLPESYGSLIPDSAGIGVGTPEPNDGGAEPDSRNGGGPSSPQESSKRGTDAWGEQPSVPGDGGAGSRPLEPGPPNGDGGAPQDTTPDAHFPPAPGPGPIVADPVASRPPAPVGSGQPPLGGFATLPGSPGSGGGSDGSGRPGSRGGVGVPGGRPGVGGEGRPGAGSRTGAGPVAGGAAAEAATRGGAGARGVGAAGGVPMGAAAGRGRAGEDEEYPRKSYLEGGNPEDLYGTDALTAPPVIGEEEKED